MTTVLTIAPLGGADMTRWCGGWATRQGEVIEVPSAANLMPTVITDGAAALNRKVHSLMASTDGDVIGFGHSQGAQILSEWLRAYANADPTRLRFVLTGNPERRHYGYAALRPKWIPPGNVRGLTPDDTPFAVLDIGRQSDRFANSLHGLAALLAFWPHAGHLDYSGVNPDEIPKKYIVKEVGNTKYANVP